MIVFYGHEVDTAKTTYFAKHKAYIDVTFAAYALAALVANGRSKMADQMELDLDVVIFNDFGIEVIVTPPATSGVPYILRGLFDSPFLGVNMGGVPIEMQSVKFSFQTSSANLLEGDEIEIDSVIYEVIRVEQDGSLTDSGGMTVAHLRVQA